MKELKLVDEIVFDDLCGLIACSGIKCSQCPIHDSKVKITLEVMPHKPSITLKGETK